MVLQFALGATRVVVLTKTRAYKIGRIRPIKFLGKVVLVMLSARHYESLHMNTTSKRLERFGGICLLVGMLTRPSITTGR